MTTAVDIDIVMRDKTKEGAQSAEQSFMDINTIIGLNKQMLKELQGDLTKLYGQMNHGEAIQGIIDPNEAKKAKELEKQIQDLTTNVNELEQSKKKEASVDMLPTADRSIKTANNLNMSIQQVAREMPTLALGPQMFFLAISNNLPILGDAIKRAKDEYNALTAAGQKSTPVWKQILSSIGSWQTLVVVGITLLTAFGKNIVDWINKLRGANTVLDNVITAQQAMNRAHIDGEAQARKELISLNALYGAATNVNRSYVERKQAVDNLQQTYPKYFENLSAEAIMAGNAAGKYRELSNAILQTAMMHAREAQLEKMAGQLWQLQMNEAGAVIAKESAEAQLNKLPTSAALPPVVGVNADYSRQSKLHSQIDDANKRIQTYHKAALNLIGSMNLLSSTMPIVDNNYTSKPPKPPKVRTPKVDKEAYSNRIDNASIEAEKKTQEMQLAAMQDGFAKRRKEAEDEHAQELAEIEKNRRDREKLIKDAEKKGVKVTPAQNNAVGAQTTAETKASDAKYNKTMKDITDDENRALAQQKVKFASTLDQEIEQINEKYNDMEKEAKGNDVLMKQYEENRGKEILKAQQDYSLKQLQLQEDVDLARMESEYKGVSDTRLAEEAKNKIMLEYAKKRLAILKTMPDENSQSEAKKLEAQIPGMTVTKKQAKNNISQIVDDALVKKLTKHFEELGMSEDDAKKKAIDYMDDFHKKAELAVSITSSLQTAFGGINGELDVVLNNINSIAEGFASGGIPGGIAATAASLISIIRSVGESEEKVQESILKKYQDYTKEVDDLIDKETDLLDKLGGSEFSSNITKLYQNYRNEVLKAQTSMTEDIWSTKDESRVKKALDAYKTELSQLGIEYNSREGIGFYLEKNIEKIKDELPDLYASLPDKVKEYGDDIYDLEEKLEELDDEVQSTILGFDFSDITSAIVDAVTDPSITDSIDDLGNSIDSKLATTVKNMLTRELLTSQVQTLLSNLLSSMEVKNADGTLTGEYKLTVDAAKEFANSIKNLGSAYKTEWDQIKAAMEAAGIDLDAATDASQTTQTGTITTITEETGTKIEGIGQALQNRLINIDERGVDVAKNITAIATNIGKIADNTAYCEHLKQLDDDIHYMRTNGIKMS